MIRVVDGRVKCTDILVNQGLRARDLGKHYWRLANKTAGIDSTKYRTVSKRMHAIASSNLMRAIVRIETKLSKPHRKILL